MPIQVDRIAADIRAIAACTQTPGNGATRPTFSAEWVNATNYVISQAMLADCEVRIDAFGNVFAWQNTLPRTVKTWLVGSHIDTVPNGGDYDGVAGVVTALELLRSAQEDDVVLPIELVIFAEEEGPTFGLGMLGSRAFVGELSAEQLGKLKNNEGQTYLEAGAPFGVDPEHFAAYRLGTEQHHGLIELHIEQGPGMWRRDQRLAVVTAIAGRRQYTVTVRGEANHAGATSMKDRHDPLIPACWMVVGLESMAHEIEAAGNHAVCTVGRIEVFPNAVNVIAERVQFTIDFRTDDSRTLAETHAKIEELITSEADNRGLSVELLQSELINTRPMSLRLVEAFQQIGVTTSTVSGALHDSAVLAPHLPTVMLFVPSKDGISHNPAEFSRVEDIAEGARVIERLVRRPAIDLINAMDANDFIRLAGRFYEHSPWVAERVFEQRPFQSVDDLANQMSRVVRNATAELQLELIRAHPDLVGKLAKENKLTKESNAEQSAAGLTQLSAIEIEQFEQFNAAYHRKFGFPFVICARQNRKDAILAAFPVRLNNSVEKEIVTALAEIDKIALLRMRDAMWE